MHGGRFLHSFVHTMRGTFDYICVMRDDTRCASDDPYTFVVAASEAQISSRQIGEANFLAGRPSSITQFKPHSDFEVWQGSQENVLVTDDFVPVDGMHAPLYLESWFFVN